MSNEDKNFNVVTFNNETDKMGERVASGVKKIADAVSSTLGPAGRTVIIQNNLYGGVPTITKDGVTVAKSITLEDSIEDIGASLVKNIAGRTNLIAGDGCQPHWAKVLTANGWVRIDELKIGDTICGSDGGEQEVLGIFRKEERTLCKVNLESQRTAECSPDHLWTVCDSKGVVSTVTTEQLSQLIKNDKYYIQRPSVDFEERSLSIDPYLLGVLIGDGSLRRSNGNVRISIGYSKEHIIEKIKNLLPAGMSLRIYHREDKHAYEMHIIGKDSNGRDLFDYLAEYDLDDKGSKDKFIPADYLYSSRDQRSRLLQGLSDTDGTINNRGLLEYSTVSTQLAADMRTLLWSLGKNNGYMCRDKKDPSCYSDTPIYRITELKGRPLGNLITSVEITEEKTPVMCIKVSNPDELYITDDFIVTHNTTTSTVLAGALVEEGLKQINKGINPINLKRGFNQAVDDTIDRLKKEARVIETKSEISQVASISANDDHAIGDLIAEAVENVGRDGVITVADSPTTETFISYVEGMQFDRGYISAYFCNDRENMTVDFENPLVLVVKGTIARAKELIPLLDTVNKKGRQLFIICNDLVGEALTLLAYNAMQGTIRVCAVKSPGFGDNQKLMMDDIAILTGSTAVDIDSGMTLGNIDETFLGSAESIKATYGNTIIVNGGGHPEVIQDRINYLRNQIEKTSGYEKEKLQERLARLSGGVAVLNIGATTEVELKEKKHRVEDSLNAARAAVDEGIIAGGGTALLKISKNLKPSKKLNEEEMIGFNIVKEALKKPFSAIIDNAGLDVKDYIESDKLKGNIGFDVLNKKWVNMYKVGIIDPVKVTRTALENAASVASLVLTSSCVITNN